MTAAATTTARFLIFEHVGVFISAWSAAAFSL